MAIRITTLSENTARMGDILGEWGLSILVEAEEATVLLDTGKKFSATHNADTLGIDLSNIDRIILSHGHSDHTGGLREVLRRMRKEVWIIAHPDIWQPKYAFRDGESDRYVGVPFQQNELESLGARFHLATQPVNINSTIMTTGEIPMVTTFEEVDAALFVKEGCTWQPDKVMDDQALIVKAEQGLIIILGCAHRGMINTLYHARKLTSTEKIHTVVGGSHLINASEERLWQTIAAIRELGVKRLGLCHCTDLPAASVLAQEFGEDFFFNKAGTTVELG